MLTVNSLGGLEEREYQVSAREAMAIFTKKWLRNELTNTKGIDLWTTMPVDMATGSGKTATVGVHLHKMFRFRDKLEKLNNRKYPLDVLVLNDRINLVNQIKADFIDGRDSKLPLLGEDIAKHAKIKLFHSKADSTETIQVTDGVDIYGEGRDSVYFSTFGSAQKIPEKDDAYHVILIDEAHHLTGETYLSAVKDKAFKSMNKKGRMPLIIPMSATIDPIRHLINEPVVNFGLAEYIASKYSPEVSYNLVTSSDFTEQDIRYLHQEIQAAAKISNIKQKKERIAELKQYIEEHLATFGGIEDLANDLLRRLPQLDHTIIFANSIDEVNEITAKLNSLTGDTNTAVALHSKIDEADADVLADYESGKKKIIVAVDKLNEGIDMPKTNNVVFWRNTNSSRVFQQQFGRGLRGDQVSFFDYTGVLRNMAWIRGINEEVKRIRNKSLSFKGSDVKRPGISMLFGSIEGVGGHTIGVEKLLNDLDELEKSNLLTKDEIRKYFDDLGGYDALMKYKEKELSNIDLKGSKITAIASTYGFKSAYGSQLQNPIGFQEFINFMYGRIFLYEKPEIKELTVQDIKSALDDLGGYEDLMKSANKLSRCLIINGHKLTNITKMYGFNTKFDLDVRTGAGFQEFLSYVYGEDFNYEKPKKEKITKDDIKKHFNNLGGYDTLIKYVLPDVRGITIKGNKIKAIIKSYGFQSKFDLSNTDVPLFKEFIASLYDKSFTYENTEKEELKQEDIKSAFDDLGGYEMLMTYNIDQVRGIEVKGNKIISIASSMGFVSKYKFLPAKVRWFQEFLSYLYGKEFTYNPKKKD